MEKYLEIKWTTSRAFETMGWNIVTLIDGDKKYKTNGGGYDMLGTVLAKWLWDHYKQDIIAKVKPHSDGGPYGFTKWIRESGEVIHYIDGACGRECIEDIARLIGLDIKAIWSSTKKEHIAFRVRPV